MVLKENDKNWVADYKRNNEILFSLPWTAEKRGKVESVPRPQILNDRGNFTLLLL